MAHAVGRDRERRLRRQTGLRRLGPSAQDSLGVPRALGLSAGGDLDHLGQLASAQPGPQVLGGGDDQARTAAAARRWRRPPRSGGRRAAPTAPAGPRRRGGARASGGPGLHGRRGPRRRGRTSRHGATGPVGPVELEDDHLAAVQVPGQAGAVTAGALDGPHPQRPCRVGEVDQVLVATGVVGTVASSRTAPVRRRRPRRCGCPRGCRRR